MAALHWTPGDPGRRRLGGGHRHGGKQRWDAPLQKLASAAGLPDRWQDLAHNRERYGEDSKPFLFP